jgi:putative protease
VYESELDELDSLVHASKAAGVDAVIASDFAVLSAANRHGLPVHISTQLSISNSDALAFLFTRGVRRVVLARECTLDDLVRIRSNLRKRLGEAAAELKIEVFAHGAMCVAVSGRCFMSGFESGRSANRGECAQPCRRSDRISSERGGEGFELEEGHVLSPKDLCTLPFLDQLVDAGVDCLKIEGRNRSADYVHTVVRTYRHALDFHRAHRGDPDFPARFAEVTSQGMLEISKVYHRGLSEGF